jgi:hypothetical protein
LPKNIEYSLIFLKILAYDFIFSSILNVEIEEIG